MDTMQDIQRILTSFFFFVIISRNSFKNRILGGNLILNLNR